MKVSHLHSINKRLTAHQRVVAAVPPSTGTAFNAAAPCASAYPNLCDHADLTVRTPAARYA